MYVSVRSDVAYLPLGINMEIESLRLDFHVLPTWMIDVEAPGNRVFETRFPIGLFQIFRLYSLTLTHTHTHTLSLSHKPEHSHSLSLTYIFPLTFSFPTQKFHFSHKVFTHKTLSFSLYLSHGLSHSHTHTHTHNHAGVEEQSPAQPSDDADKAEPSHRLLSSSISLSLTRRSFLLFSLSLITTPIPIPILLGKLFI